MALPQAVRDALEVALPQVRDGESDGKKLADAIDALIAQGEDLETRVEALENP